MIELIPHLEHKKHIIWDWNGTLLNDVDFCIEIISTMLSEYGLPTIDKIEYLERFRFPIIEYYEEIGFDFDHVPFPDLSHHFISRYKAGMETRTSLYDGAREILAQLSQRGISSSILSAANERDLVQTLERYEIRHHFVEVFGLSDHHATSKLQRGVELMAALELAPESLILIGDTNHDLEVAAAMGIEVLLVSGGHQGEERLRALHPKVASRRSRSGF